MKMLPGLIVLISLVNASPHATAQASESLGENGMVKQNECIVRLELPQYPNIARAARFTGTADADVRLGTKGEVLAVRVEGVKPILRDAVERALRSSRYSGRCGGSSVRLQFQFEIVGRPREYPWTSVSFIPPTTFVIRTEPNLPMP